MRKIEQIVEMKVHYLYGIKRSYRYILPHGFGRADYLDDGIKATGLIQDVYLLPGFIKLADGYSSLRNRLTKYFDLAHGKNYFEFAYDWRRDNRVAARLLKKLIDEKLPKWQEKNPEAEVILIAHSMGGLISRYYLEH